MAFKFKVDEKQWAAIEANFKKDVQDVLAKPAVMREIGEFMTERLKFQARTQAPFNKSGLFPGLKDSTIKSRAYLEKYNKTHETYARTRSNLTITGALLDSITFLITGPGLVELLFTGTHPRYRGKNGAIGKEVANADLARWQAEGGRPVFDKSLKDNPTVKSRIRSIALAYVRRGLKVRNGLG